MLGLALPCPSCLALFLTVPRCHFPVRAELLHASPSCQTLPGRSKNACTDISPACMHLYVHTHYLQQTPRHPVEPFRQLLLSASSVARANYPFLSCLVLSCPPCPDRPRRVGRHILEACHACLARSGPDCRPRRNCDSLSYQDMATTVAHRWFQALVSAFSDT